MLLMAIVAHVSDADAVPLVTLPCCEPTPADVWDVQLQRPWNRWRIERMRRPQPCAIVGGPTPSGPSGVGVRDGPRFDTERRFAREGLPTTIG